MVRVIIRLPLVVPVFLIRVDVGVEELLVLLTTVRGTERDFFLQLHMIDQNFVLINIVKFQFHQYLA